MVSTVVDQERYYNQMVRSITPGLIEEHDDHLVIDKDTYVTCMVVGVPPSRTGRGFPPNLSNDFTDQILSLEATNEYLLGISYSCIPVPHETAQDLIDNALYNNKISRHKIDEDMKKSSGVSAHSLRYDHEANDYVKLYDTFYNNEQRLFDCQYIITIWAKSRDGLKHAISRITGVLNANITKAEVPYYSVLDTFLAAQPYPTSSDIAEIQQISHDCGVLVPLRDPLTQLADNGLIYGERKADGAPFIVDLDGLAAGHHLIVGSTGSGKTVLLMKLLMGCYDLLGHRFIYITPKSDNKTNYLAVAEYYKDNACVVNIGSNKGYNNINPLQVTIDKNGVFIDDADYVSSFNNHLELVTAFFRVLNTSDNMDNYVNESLIEVYRRKGIVRKDPDTWKNLPGDKWPVLLDLREVWKEGAKNKNPSAEAMINRTSRLETSWEYINRPTDITFDKDIIIIDISSVPNTLQDAMNVFVTGLVGMRFNTELTKKTNVIIDEGRVFLNDKKLAEFILKIYTQGRSFGLNAWFTTQQPSDAKDDDVRELLFNNSFVNVIMGNVQPNSYEMIQKFFKLSSKDIDELRGCGIGQGLVQVNNSVTAVKFSLTDLESNVILGTDIKSIDADGYVGLKLKDKRFNQFVEKYDCFIDDWVDGDVKQFCGGKDRFKVQRVFTPGTTRINIATSKIHNGQIMNQSIDHFSTVLQIASYLVYHGVTVEVYDYHNADIVVKHNGKTLAIEYERPGTHTVAQLIDKKQRLLKAYDAVLFVCTSTDKSKLMDNACLGQNQVVTRGAMLKEYIDNFISNNQQKQ